ncbi:hypothetical protein ACFVFJ_45660 [Streptomyces sp. NPDC057717]|uniref:hypothetical protein n=1 Tax=Streptomyces sp. NPDC057717 TaxID=3346224 RepID=UPI0036D1A1FC
MSWQQSESQHHHRPAQTADAATLARCLRGHRGPALCQRRDLRRGSLPRALATFRSLAISLTHLAGWTNNTAAHDHFRNHPADALCGLGLTG